MTYKLYTLFLDECQGALADAGGATWERAKIISWSKEAFNAFPILRPVTYTYTMSATRYQFSLPDNFRDVMSVEYPVDEDPPHFMTRMSKYDTDFYASDDNFDIERDYIIGRGWWCWGSGKFANGSDVTVNYLATHDTDLEDLAGNYISIPPEHEHICMAYVVMKAFTERLASYMKNPSAYTGVIAQMVTAADNARQQYNLLVSQAIQQLNPFRPTPKFQADKFDRVY